MINSWKFDGKCYKCKELFSLKAHDLIYKIDFKWYHSKWGGYHNEIDNYYINCPRCKISMIMDRFNVPDLIKNYVRERSEKLRAFS